MTMRARVASILLVWAVGACSGAPGSLPKAIRDHQFSCLKGMTVENNDGEKLGVLADVALDTETGAPEFGIVKTSGIGRFAKKRVVPAEYFEFGSIKSEVLSLDVVENRWANAPLLDAKNVERLNQPNHRREILAYYQNRGATGENERVAGLSPTGRTKDENTKSSMSFATDLIHNDVLDVNHKRIGKVSDFLVDPQGRHKTMLIISTGSFLRPGKRYAVPFDAVSVDENKEAVILKGNFDTSLARPFNWMAARSDTMFSY